MCVFTACVLNGTLEWLHWMDSFKLTRLIQIFVMWDLDSKINTRKFFSCKVHILKGDATSPRSELWTLVVGRYFMALSCCNNWYHHKITTPTHHYHMPYWNKNTFNSLEISFYLTKIRVTQRNTDQRYAAVSTIKLKNMQKVLSILQCAFLSRKHLPLHTIIQTWAYLHFQTLPYNQGITSECKISYHIKLVSMFRFEGDNFSSFYIWILAFNSSNKKKKLTVKHNILHS